MANRKVLQVRLDSKTDDLIEMIVKETGRTKTDVVKSGIKMIAAEVASSYLSKKLLDGITKDNKHQHQGG